MAIETWLVFALAYLAVTFSPGPNVLIVISHAVKYGYRKIFTTILANLTCQLGIVIAVAMGVGALMTVDSTAFKAIKMVGAAYLVFLGVSILYKLVRNEGSPGAKTDSPVAPSTSSRFRQAFFVSAGNPKTVIFLAAFLPQFLDQQQPLFEQFAVMYMTIALTVLIVHAAYAWFAVKVKQRVASRRLRTGASAASGLLYIFLGGALSRS